MDRRLRRSSQRLLRRKRQIHRMRLMMKTLSEFQDVYQLPLPELIFRAASVHRQHHDPADIQRCVLLSVKTGGCPEDYGYCAQSARFKTGVEATRGNRAAISSRVGNEELRATRTTTTTRNGSAGAMLGGHPSDTA